MKKIYLLTAFMYTMSALAQTSSPSAKPGAIDDLKVVKEKENIFVKWAVADETYIDEYRVQRSSNGVQFYTIGTLKSKATPAAYNYSFPDLAATSGVNHYRLAIIENGKMSYSKIATIKNATDKNSFTVSNQGQNLNLKLSGIEAGTYRLSVMNTSGQILQSLSIIHDGSDVIKQIDMKGGITKGVYRVTLQGQNAQFIKSILVQ
jgi:hypothetical protein